MKFNIARKFRGMPAVEYVEEVLDLFDTTQLSEFKVRDGSGYFRVHPQAWGNCKHPTSHIPSYRISCSVKGGDSDFPTGPYPGKGYSYHVGTLRHQHVAQNLQEVIAWVSGHELYHYLADTRQVLTSAASEPIADMVGYEFLYSIREGIAPVELAAAVSEIGREQATHSHDVVSFGYAFAPIVKPAADALKIAPNRIPYTGLPKGE